MAEIAGVSFPPTTEVERLKIRIEKLRLILETFTNLRRSEYIHPHREFEEIFKIIEENAEFALAVDDCLKK